MATAILPLLRSTRLKIPNPQDGTNNYYDQDGYSGGSYTNCTDITQPAVARGRELSPVSDPSHRAQLRGRPYYLLNNYNPGYDGDGTLDSQYYAVHDSSHRPVRTSATFCPRRICRTRTSAKTGISTSRSHRRQSYDRYCNICNPFQYATDIMTNPTQREAHIEDADRPL